MNRVTTEGIILRRTNFGEADRIITVLTPDHGKVRLMAKGVRKSRSKLAGGIELFSVSFVTYIVGRGDINTLISTRLKKHYGRIVKDVNRTMFGYDMIKLVDRITEDGAEEDYFDLLKSATAALDDFEVNTELIRLWLYLQLLSRGGHSPNLKTDINKQVLKPQANYSFSFDDMAFAPAQSGPYNSAHIKLLRLAAKTSSAVKLKNVQGAGEVLGPCVQLVKTVLSSFVRL